MKNAESNVKITIMLHLDVQDGKQVISSDRPVFVKEVSFEQLKEALTELNGTVKVITGKSPSWMAEGDAKSGTYVDEPVYIESPMERFGSLFKASVLELLADEKSLLMIPTLDFRIVNREPGVDILENLKTA